MGQKPSYLHWSKARLHPDNPFDGLPVLVTVVIEADLVVLVILVGQVEKHRTTFEDTLLLTRSLVDHGRDTAVG